MRLRLLAHLLALTAFTAPAFAADPAPTLPQRVDRIEKELKAVQRKVFPGGSTYFEPEIAPPAATEQTGTPASQPLNDLTTRVDGIERALSQLTSQVEEAQHRLQLLSDQSAKDRKEYDTRLKLLEAAAQPPAPAVAETPPPEAPVRPAKGKPGKLAAAPAEAPVAAVDKAAAKAAAPADAAKAGPASGDPAEDAYMAGYRLWADKKYADAEAALEKVAKQYPKHKRASYARNLLGRAQLDEGKPATAAQTFLGNYQSDPHGERAAESLFYLGQSLTQLKKTDNACRAYDELQDVYGSTMSDALKARLPAARKAAACK